MAHPRMYDDANPKIRRVRQICLALPEAYEKEAWGECTFRVTGGSMFAMTDNDHHGSGHVAVWVRSSPMVQEILVHSGPDRFFVPPYVGAKGWIGVKLGSKVDWDEVRDLLADAHALSAPKRARRAGARNAKAAPDAGAAKPRRGAASAPPTKTRSAKAPRRKG